MSLPTSNAQVLVLTAPFAGQAARGGPALVGHSTEDHLLVVGGRRSARAARRPPDRAGKCHGREKVEARSAGATGPGRDGAHVYSRGKACCCDCQQPEMTHLSRLGLQSQRPPPSCVDRTGRIVLAVASRPPLSRRARDTRHNTRQGASSQSLLVAGCAAAMAARPALLARPIRFISGCSCSAVRSPRAESAACASSWYGSAAMRASHDSTRG